MSSGGPPIQPSPIGPSAEVEPHEVSPLTLFRVFFVVGLTSFGMAILQNIRSVTARRGWLSREEIDEGLGLVQLYPGAIGVDLVAYIGYRMRRIRGALAATAGFATPALLLMLGLSWAYVEYGASGNMAQMVVGLSAIVVGVVASITLDFAGQHARGRVEAVLAVGAFAVGMAGLNLLWAVLGALVIGAFALRPKSQDRAQPRLPDARISGWRLALSLVPAAVVAAGVIVAVLVPGALATLTAGMAKTGSVAFGNGSTILPVLRQDAVEVHRWLTPEAFAVGVGFGQITPGPYLMTAAFIGFNVAGWVGGVLAAVAIFAPSVAMTMVAAEVYPYLRRLTAVRGAIRGIMAAFVGLLGTVVFSLSQQILDIPAALVLAAATLAFVRAFKLNLLVVFGAGLAAWAVYLLINGPVGT